LDHNSVFLLEKNKLLVYLESRKSIKDVFQQVLIDNFLQWHLIK